MSTTTGTDPITPIVAPGTPTPRQEVMARFESHELTPDAAEDLDKARVKVKTLASYLHKTLPEGREKAQALTALEMTMFHTSAAIARHS